MARRSSRGFLKRASVWALAALFAAVLLGVSAHGHAGDDSSVSHPCAVCSVATATQAAALPSADFLAPLFSAHAFLPGVELALAGPIARTPLSRGPPRALASSQP